MFRTVLVGGPRVPGMIEHRLVQAVTLTGSTPAGRFVARKAGEMLKKTVLELGGSDPYIVLEDADLEEASSICVASRLINAGQSCIAAKRFIVVEAVRERFEALFVEKMRSKIMGDPLDEKTDIGPQARHDLRDDLHRQVLGSVEKGAKMRPGRARPRGKRGLLSPDRPHRRAKTGSPAYDEELFGPVAAIIPAKDEAEAVRIANDTVFGLGAAVFTKDKRARRENRGDGARGGVLFRQRAMSAPTRVSRSEASRRAGTAASCRISVSREFVNIKTVYVG